MYKEKMLEQLERLEALQEECGICDVSEAVKPGYNILSLAKKIDEFEEKESRERS